MAREVSNEMIGVRDGSSVISRSTLTDCMKAGFDGAEKGMTEISKLSGQASVGALASAMGSNAKDGLKQCDSGSLAQRAHEVSLGVL